MLQKSITFIANIGARPDDTEVFSNERRVALFGALGGIVVQLMISLAYYASGAMLPALVILFFPMFMALGMLLFGLTRRNFWMYWHSWIVVALISGPAGALLTGATLLDYSPVVWGFMAPLFVMVVKSPRHAVVWLVAFFLVAISTVILQMYLDIPKLMSQSAQISITTINFVAFHVFIFATLYYFINQRDLAYRLLRGEQEKSENLLLNILPKDIAAILKNENRVIAESFEGASILFADVVNFTPMSAQMKAVELVELLNEVFTHFDLLVETYGLEKIKTIGDCYMVAAGVPQSRADHAQVLTRLALHMQSHVAGREFYGRKLMFRIGINSGPVVAGVIGRKKFIYDLWGDAVNTASRMESHGQGGTIQITRATYDLVCDEFICESRGTVHIKGKGEMEVWLVTGPIPALG